MSLSWIFGILLLSGFIGSKKDHSFSQIEKNGMKLRWKVEGENLICELSAPTKGWIAMGFNTQSGLSKTNLIMGAIRKGKAVVEDHHILSPGVHKKMEALGAKSLIHSISGKETTEGTRIQFSIPLNPKDSYHHHLKKGNTYYVLLAYSWEDDFDHHSAMRTEVEIIL